jgi:hypothetical protein
MPTLRSSAVIISALLLVPATTVAQETTGSSPPETTGVAPHNETFNGVYGTNDTIHVTKGIASTFRLDTREPFETVTIGDNKIIDVAPLTDHTLIIQAHETGTTNMIFLNTAKVPIKNVAVVVDAQGSGFVKIHNKAKLNSYTMFSCWDKGCQFAGENTVAEPAPLPRGHSKTSIDQAVSGEVNEGSPAQPAGVTVPVGRPNPGM